MARQRYYGEKFKPTKGAFGGTSKYNRRLKEQAKLKAQIAEMEEKKKQDRKAKEVVESNNLKVELERAEIKDLYRLAGGLTMPGVQRSTPAEREKMERQFSKRGGKSAARSKAKTGQRRPR